MLIGASGVGLSDATDADAIGKLIRGIFRFLDIAVYSLLSAMYKIFFNVASADIFSAESILQIYRRFQLIIGVFMVFQLALIIIRGIINVEEVSGAKNSEFVKRVIIALTMLTLLTPINIPNASNEFEKRVNNNGLLFGVLYSLQYRILSNDTLGRLVLGSSATENSTNTKNQDVLSESASQFTNTIIKSFVKINLKSDNESDMETPKDGSKNWEIQANNRMCTISQDSMKIYLSEDSSPSQLFSLTAEKCSNNGNKRWAFTYMVFVTTVVGVIFVLLLASFTIDIAIRSIKLAVLRIIAPIPIISYIDPKGSKDSGFNSWVKTLTQTYLELFIRLAIIYFVIYVIQDIVKNGLIIDNAGGLVGALSVVFIFIGLFFFAKEAPKFLQNAIGMKEAPGGFFSSGKKALAMGAAGLGAIGSARASRIASRESDETRKGSQKFSEQTGLKAKGKNLLNKGKHIVAGIGGFGSGLATGVSAGVNAKDHNLAAVRKAQYDRNMAVYQNGVKGSSMFGRAKTSLARTFGGLTYADKGDLEINRNERRESSATNLKDVLLAKGKVDGANNEIGAGTKISVGKKEFILEDEDTYSTLMSQISKAQYNYTYNGGPNTVDIHGTNLDLNTEVEKFQEEVALASGTTYVNSNADVREGLSQVFDNYESAFGKKFESGSQVKKDALTAKNAISNTKNDPKYISSKANSEASRK